MIETRNVTGSIALNYIMQELAIGSALSKCINNLPLSNGEVYAFVPSGTSESKLYDFEYGALYPFDQEWEGKGASSMPIPNDSRPILVERIQQYLKLNIANCCIFEEPVRSPADPIVATSALDYVHLGDGRMFYFFNSSQNRAEKINKAISVSEDYIFLCALSYLDPILQNEFLPNKEISLNLLEKFAAGVTSFFIKAYDHEGYLMWVKNE